MTLVEVVRQASQQPLTMPDGEPCPLQLASPLDADSIDEFEASLPCPLPEDVRELLNFCSGFSGGAVDFVEFTGRQCFYERQDVFPHGLPIAADGFGNFWVVDLQPSSTVWGPIYFDCHDPPVTLYQGESLEGFLTELFKLSQPPFQSLVDDVHEDRIFEVWRKNPGVLEYADCISSNDAAITSFSHELGPRFQFVDLRNPSVGFGFSWGRYGPRTLVKRHGQLPIFAYERKGFLARLIGK